MECHSPVEKMRHVPLEWICSHSLEADKHKSGGLEHYLRYQFLSVRQPQSKLAQSYVQIFFPRVQMFHVILIRDQLRFMKIKAP